MSHPWDSISGPLFASYILSVPSSVMFSDLAIFWLGSLSHYYWVVKNNIIHIYIWSTNHLPRVSQILCLVYCLSFNYQSPPDILYGVCWIFTATTGFFSLSTRLIHKHSTWSIGAFHSVWWDAADKESSCVRRKAETLEHSEGRGRILFSIVEIMLQLHCNEYFEQMNNQRLLLWLP